MLVSAWEHLRSQLLVMVRLAPRQRGRQVRVGQLVPGQALARRTFVANFEFVVRVRQLVAGRALARRTFAAEFEVVLRVRSLLVLGLGCPPRTRILGFVLGRQAPQVLRTDGLVLECLQRFRTD